jgi:hypothetical protein
MMLSRVRKHLTYANAAMTIALVFAMSGGAYAAGKLLITSTKQISPSVLKSLKGKTGVNGAQGPAGAVGPAGAAGAKGEPGPPGPAGTTGEKGGPGEKGAAGTNGFNGTNGKEGKEGKEGSPWTAKGSLPVGSTESGQWSFVVHQVAGAPIATASISFAIQLANPLSEEDSHFIGPEEGEGEPKAHLPKGCSGNYKAPRAASGNLCVFTQSVLDFEGEGGTAMLPLPFTIHDVETGEQRAGKSGAYLAGFIGGGKAGDEIVGVGDWVVTG